MRRSTHPTHTQPSKSSLAVPVSAPKDESLFFDRVKRALDNRDTYNEFLKLVNLFTQNYIDTARLVKDSWNYLGNGELMSQFKEILGWDESKERESWLLEQQQQHGWSRPSQVSVLDRPTRAELNLKYGSYRRLPASVSVASTYLPVSRI
jgi:paired amphipathic helix protein Sin3a